MNDNEAVNAQEARGWSEAERYAPGDLEAQDDFMTGWRTALRAETSQGTNDA